MTKDTITLNDDLYLAEGLRRVVYQHPLDSALCIKILKPTASKRTLRREIRYVKKYSQRVDCVPSYHGKVMTNKGKGYVFGLVCNHNGGFSQSLENTLKSQSLPGLLKKIIQSYELLLDKRVLVTDLHARNVVVKVTETDYELHYVDGAENTDFIKACDYSKRFLKRKLDKKFTQLCKSIDLEYDFTAHVTGSQP